MIPIPSKTHPWIYVIIPVSRPEHSGTDIVFAAFCKDCRTYFTEEINTGWDGEARLWPSKLPREGCGADVADEGFSSLPGIDR
jgi:hypothetical protein